MTITNDERREVAENLRTMTVCGCRYKEQFYELLEETVMPEWEFHSFDTIAERLADLIEPTENTCKFMPYSEKSDDGICSKCGAYMYEQDNYCPDCGARVTN